MAASEHLNPQLFHGTSHFFSEGDTVNAVPGWTGEPSEFDVAHATPSKRDAEDYAGYKAQKQGQLFAPVYGVTPVDPTEHYEWGNGTSASPKEFAEKGTIHGVHSRKGFKVEKQAGWGINPDVWVPPSERLY